MQCGTTSICLWKLFSSHITAENLISQSVVLVPLQNTIVLKFSLREFAYNFFFFWRMILLNTWDGKIKTKNKKIFYQAQKFSLFSLFLNLLSSFFNFPGQIGDYENSTVSYFSFCCITTVLSPILNFKQLSSLITIWCFFPIFFVMSKGDCIYSNPPKFCLTFTFGTFFLMFWEV